MKIKLLKKILIISVTLFVVDLCARNIELSSLIESISKSEEIMKKVKHSHQATAAMYWKNSKWSDFHSAELEYVSTAEIYAPKLATTQSKITDIFILPWHTSLKDVRNHYVDNNQAWLESLNFESILNDELLWSQKKYQEINNTWAVFCSNAKKSIPIIDFSNNNQKIVNICKKDVSEKAAEKVILKLISLLEIGAKSAFISEPLDGSQLTDTEIMVKGGKSGTAPSGTVFTFDNSTGDFCVAYGSLRYKRGDQDIAPGNC